MKIATGTVVDGKVVLQGEAPAEGAVVTVLAREVDGDWLDPEDRAALDEALCLSEADIAAGRLVDAADVLKELRSR